jgi:hypothetical protein
MSSEPALVSPVEIEEHGAGLPVHPAGLDGGPELGSCPAIPASGRDESSPGPEKPSASARTRRGQISRLHSGSGAGDPNFYAYVSNSPTNFTDPSGRCGPFCVVGLVFDGYDVYKLITGFMIVRL